MVRNHQELDVEVTNVSLVGAMVKVDGMTGFIDQRKYPDWHSEVNPPKVGDRIHVVVLDDSREPPRLSALDTDIRIARALREQPPLH
ncbi:S1 RNA-binding domain-containing protein [Streptomyces sp. NPDC096354]|uniref:S1 RNA-binding domain-containing protein n=1 Tax=Streptomyces sp. NPDC096354 TaxID=3366088 RepID=UPI00381E1BE8